MTSAWHLWVVGFVSLLWNGFGALDYLMTQLRTDWYVRQFSPDQLDYFYAMPRWVDAAWAFGVWFAVLGSIFLLLRSRFAVVSFVISLAGMIVASAYPVTISDQPPGELIGPAALLFSAAIVVVGALLIWYARSMRIRGVLR